jgi:SLOG cluster4 family
MSKDATGSDATTRPPTFDEELLRWLGDEAGRVRADDVVRVREIAAELADGFNTLSGIGRAVTVFGSARTTPDDPDYSLMREVAAELGRRGYAVITGGGGGLMEAANRGAQDAGDLHELQVVRDPGEVAEIVAAAYRRARADRQARRVPAASEIRGRISALPHGVHAVFRDEAELGRA